MERYDALANLNRIDRELADRMRTEMRARGIQMP